MLVAGTTARRGKAALQEAQGLMVAAAIARFSAAAAIAAATAERDTAMEHIPRSPGPWRPVSITQH